MKDEIKIGDYVKIRDDYNSTRNIINVRGKIGRVFIVPTNRKDGSVKWYFYHIELLDYNGFYNHCFFKDDLVLITDKDELMVALL